MRGFQNLEVSITDLVNKPSRIPSDKEDMIVESLNRIRSIEYDLHKTRKTLVATTSKRGELAESLEDLKEETLQALKEYGPKGISQQGTELFLMAISKILETTPLELKDQVVVVLILKEAHSSQPEELLNVVSSSLPSTHFLEEAKTSLNSTLIAKLALVRLTLARFTRIVLIIATLIGVYLLMNMSLTRDTLLYSNVKLD